MAVSRVIASWGCLHYLQGRTDIDYHHHNHVFFGRCLKADVRFVKWRRSAIICSTGPLAKHSTPAEDENSSSTSDSSPSDESESRKLVEDLNSVSETLSLTDIHASPSSGSKARVAYQGVPGAYSEAAALKAYPDCEAIPKEQFEDVFEAVELGQVEKAVLPIENSLGGSIHCNYDLLLRHRLHIVGEVYMAVNHCLLALPGVRKKDLKRVLSHQQALAQCEMNLSHLKVIGESVYDTAGAAQLVASNGLKDVAAVASARAAEIYGLEILEEGIQDDPDNVTRFLILAREPIISGTDRLFMTSIVFALEDGPGALVTALLVFLLWKINMTKQLQIESRPLRKRPLRVVDDSNTGRTRYFDYLFYVDIEASMADLRAQKALNSLKEFATFFRVLGCYPLDTTL